VERTDLRQIRIKGGMITKDLVYEKDNMNKEGKERRTRDIDIYSTKKNNERSFLTAI